MIKSLEDVKPLHNNALLREMTNENATIITPDNASAENRKFEVLAIGPGITLETGVVVPPGCVVGDIVLVRAAPSINVRVLGKNYALIDASGIVAVVGRVPAKLELLTSRA